MNLNKSFFIGRIGKTPEVRYLDNGQAVCKFSIAVDDGYYNKETNAWVDRTVWTDIVAWAKLAEKMAKFDKGLLVLVECKYTNRKVEKNGETKYYHEFVAHSVKAMEKREQAQSNGTENIPMAKIDPIGEEPSDDLPF